MRTAGLISTRLTLLYSKTEWPSHSAYSEQTVAVRLGDYQILYFIIIKVFSCNSYDENKKTIFFKYLASEHKLSVTGRNMSRNSVYANISPCYLQYFS